MSSTADVEALRAQFISEKEAIEEGLRGEMDGMRVAHVSAVTAASSEREAAVATLRGEIDAAEETLRGHLTAKVMKRLRNMAVAAAVAAWLEYVDNQRYRRDATKGLMKRVQNVAVASAFAGWVESVDADAAEKERLRITMTFHREMNSVQETMNTKLLESIAQKIRMRVAAKALGSWCDFTESRREMKQTTEKVLRRIKHMAVVSALEAWVELVEEKCAAAEQLKAVLKRGRNGSLSRSFGGWVSVASEKTSAQDLRNQKSRRVIERMLQLVLETSVEHWRDWTARKIFVKSKLSQVVRRIRKVALSCAFRCWVKTAHEDATEHARMAEIEALSVRFVSERETAEKSLRSEMDEILASHVSAEEALVAARDMEAGTAARTLKEVLASAESAGIEAHQRETALRRQAVEQQTALRSEAKQLEVARRSEAAELQGQAELREAGLRSEAEQRETALHSEAKEREAALQNDLQQAEEAMRRRVLASSAQKMRMHGVTKALNAWRSYARRKAITKLLTKKASLHLQHVVCTAAFAVWKQVTESAKSEKTRLGYVVKRIQQMVAAAALVTWRDWASKKVYVKQKLQQVIYRVTEMALQDTFEQWAATAHRAAYVRAIGDEAFERSVHRVVKKRFDAMVLLSRQTRRVRTVTETWGHRQTLAAYKVWAALVVEQYRLAELEAARSELQQTKETMNARIIAAAVQKMRSHNLGKAMRRWYDFFQRERAERHKTAKVIQLIKHLPLLAAVSRWVEHVTEVRVMRKKLMATVTRMQKNALSGAFMHWLTTVARTLQIRGVGERMMRWRCGLAVASSFAKWIAAVRQEVAEHERLMYMATFHTEMNSAQETMTKRILASTAQKVKMREVVKGFNTWCAVVQEKVAVRNMMVKVMNRMQNIALLTAWSAWVECVDERIDRMVTALRRIQSIAVRHVLYHWAADARRTVELCNILGYSIAQMRNAALARIFRALWAPCHKARALDQMYSKVVRRMQHVFLAKSFTALWTHHYKMQGVHSILLRWRFMKLRDTFFLWVEAMDVSIGKQERETFRKDLELAREMMHTRVLTAAAQKVRMHGASKTINAWRGFAKRKTAIKATLVFVLHRIGQVCLACAFAGMVDFMHQIYRMRAMTVRWSHRRTLYAFCEWAELVAEQAHFAERDAFRNDLRRLEELMSAERSEHQCDLQKAEDTMNERVLAAAVQKMKIHCLSKSMRIWHDIFQLQVSERNKIAKVMQRIRQLPMAVALSTWQRFVVDVKATRKTLTVAITRMRMIRQSRAFATWLTRIRFEKVEAERVKTMALFHNEMKSAQEMMTKRILASTAQKIRQRDIVKTLNTWRGAVKYQVTVREMMVKVAQRIQNMAVSVAFSTWAAQVQHQRNIRDKAKTAMQRLRNTMLSRVWETWKFNASEQARAAERDGFKTDLQKAEQMMNTHVLASTAQLNDVENTLTTWLFTAIDQKADLRYAARSMRVWHGFASRKVTIRKILSKAVQRLVRLALSCVFAGWQKLARRAQYVDWRMGRMQLIWEHRRTLGAYKTWAQRAALAIAKHEWKQAATIHQSQQHYAIGIILRKMLVSSMGKAFNAWQGLASRSFAARTTAETVIRRIRNIALTRVVTFWYRRVEQINERKRQLHGILRRKQNLRLSRGFMKWQVEAHHAARVKLIGVRAILRVQHAVIARCFDSWWARRCTMRSVRSILIRMQHRLEQLVFGAWADWVTEEIADRARLEEREAVQSDLIRISARADALQTVLKSRDAAHAAQTAKQKQELVAAKQQQEALAITAGAHERHAREVARVEMIASLTASLSPRGGGSPSPGTRPPPPPLVGGPRPPPPAGSASRRD